MGVHGQLREPCEGQGRGVVGLGYQSPCPEQAVGQLSAETPLVVRSPQSTEPARGTALGSRGEKKSADSPLPSSSPVSPLREGS